MIKKIAIIGCSLRLPSTDTTNFWEHLIEEKNLISKVNSKRWSQDSFNHPNKKHPGTSYTFAAGSIGDITKFDAEFFGISPREAALMDPQQRLLLEMSWEAIENAGIKPSAMSESSCGVFIGMATTDYASRLADDLSAIDSLTATGITASIAANRISYIFNLRGPSMVIDTACSSSMVAFHQACNSIRSGEITQALVGGVSLHIHPHGFIIFSKASMLSPQGQCNPFDASGDGYVRSEGGGVFFIKDYEQAVADGDPILAVVANSSNNTDGKKSSLTMPSASVQEELLQDVYQQANIAPESIDYIEAHGTGTAVGDPVESTAIGNALGKKRKTPLPIGSVKSNLGHLEAASAVAGLAKAIFAIQQRKVPATIGIKSLNPNIPFTDLNITVNTKCLPLKETGKLTIGVNSFGFGGANAHVILESPPLQAQQSELPVVAHQIPVMLFAKNNIALKSAALEFSNFLSEQAESKLYTVAYNAMFNREWHEHRVIAFGSSRQSIAKKLLNFSANDSEQDSLTYGIALKAPAGTAFIYSGNGSQWEGMGKQLLADEPLFKKSIQAIDIIFQRYADYSLEDELAGKNELGRYEYTEFAQPALFALQVGITQLLQHQGITPTAVAGHSVGEVAAAWASGALSLEDAVAVIFHRSKFQGKTKGKGNMTAVGLGLDAAQSLLNKLNLASSISIAGVNSSRGITVAGEPHLLTQFETELTKQDIFNKRLDIDYAFHSPVMDDIEIGIKQALTAIKPTKSDIPFYSSVTGDLLAGTELNADYWWHNIRQPVLFEQAIKNTVLDNNIFIEIGPHAVLRSYINDSIKDLDIDASIIPTITRNNGSYQQILNTCGKAMIAGSKINWKKTFPTAAPFLSLPNYPWQRETHWLPVTSESIGLLDRYKIHPLLGYPLKQHESTWENQLDTLLIPTLNDHRVGEAIVFPGSGFCELAIAAAFTSQASELVEIEELEIHSPLLLSAEQSKLIRLNIDTSDSNWKVQGRDYGVEEPWTLFAQGRILIEPSDILLRNVTFNALTRPADFNSESHNKLTISSGLNYGPAFQCIEHGWIEQNSVLAALKIPEIITTELESMYLHPAILDCTFQLIFQLLKKEASTHTGITFIPTKMGRITFANSKSKPSFAKATLLRRTPRSLTADFTIFNEDGLAIAAVNNVQFRSIRLSTNASDRIRFFDYHSIPAPHIDNEINIASISNQAIQSAFGELKTSDQRYSEEVEPLLDILCSQFTKQALQQLFSDEKTLSTEKIHSLISNTPEIEPFLHFLLKTAENEQYISFNKQTWSLFQNEDDQISAQDIWNSLVADYPDYFQIIHSVGRIGLHTTSLLSGNLTFKQICPQETTLTTLSQQALGAVNKQKISLILRNLIIEGISELPEGNRLRILEVSEGSPSFAMDICLAIDFTSGDYIFASTSEETLEESEHIKERFPYISTHYIDQEDSTTVVNACDIAIISLDFNTLQQANTAITYAKNNLKPGGSLLIVGQYPAHWIDFLFGCQRNYWLNSEEQSWLPNQRSSDFWQQQLIYQGFTNTNIFNLSTTKHSGAYLLLGQLDDSHPLEISNTEVKSGTWVLVSKENDNSLELSNHLTTKLQAKGYSVLNYQAHDENDFTSFLGNATVTHDNILGIIHLAEIFSELKPLSAESTLRKQVSRCNIAVDIVKACEVTELDTTCWLVTSGAASSLLPQQSTPTTPISVDSALWGFGRTLINEASNFSVQLIDIPTSTNLDIISTALIKELIDTDGEQEIILTDMGNRYVPRLNLVDKHPVSSQHTIEDSTIRLGFEFPGQLRNLRWEIHPTIAPKPDEVEIEVHASGLNFRDVMFTLGLLSDEAIENGFSGPTLGLEFSGTIINCSADNSDFSLGDKVVGFGPSSFGNRVITKSNAISHIPAGISFEAATTIPSTFFTVYYSLHHLARLQPNEKILIHGAAGGVGIAAIQIAKWLGAEIYATAGSDEKRDFLKLLGVDHIFDSRSLAFSDEILEQTNQEGVDVVLNSLAGEAINRNFSALKPFGRFLELGKRDFYENTKIGLRPFRNNISYFGIDADQLMKLRPDLTKQLFSELMDLFSNGTLTPLPYHAFEAEDIVEAFRYMQQARQIGKIVITYKNGINNPYNTIPVIQESLILSPNGSYLVTGGLSGFGLRSAEWLASKGAKSLILISRSGPVSEEAKLGISRLEQLGVQIHAVACDITNKQEISNLLSEITKDLPPLKGVIHAATVINDGLIRNMDAKQIETVLAPKSLGAQYLHELTINLSLDLFILFSSATTLFGNPGQSNYVAANSCLEALASHRQEIGLPVTCVRWGAIDDVGFLARNEKTKEALQSRMGGEALNSAVALDILEHMILSKQSNMGVMELDWNALSRFLPSADTPKFKNLALLAKDNNNNQDNSDDIQHMLEELSDSELFDTLIEMLKNEIGEILRISPEKIDPSRSIYDMGLDSLMGVELVVALEARFGVRLPVMALSQNPTITKLTERLILQLKGNSEIEDDSEENALLSQTAQLHAQHDSDDNSDSIASIAAEVQSLESNSQNKIIK